MLTSFVLESLHSWSLTTVYDMFVVSSYCCLSFYVYTWIGFVVNEFVFVIMPTHIHTTNEHSNA